MSTVRITDHFPSKLEKWKMCKRRNHWVCRKIILHEIFEKITKINHVICLQTDAGHASEVVWLTRDKLAIQLFTRISFFYFDLYSHFFFMRQIFTRVFPLPAVGENTKSEWWMNHDIFFIFQLHIISSPYVETFPSVVDKFAVSDRRTWAFPRTEGPIRERCMKFMLYVIVR